MRKLILVLGCLLALTACGDDDDSMMMTDSGTDAATDTMMGMDTNMAVDSGPPPTPACDAPREITLAMGDQEIAGDLAMANQSLEVTDCGSSMVREAIALTLPGSGPLGVTFSLESATTGELDTVVQIRTAGCSDETDALCFDDAGSGMLFSAGSFLAEGGSTVHMIVSGFGADTIGPWAGNITVATANPPTLTGGSVKLIDGELMELELMGEDADEDATGYFLSFLNADGDVIAFDADGDPMTPETLEEITPDFFEAVEGSPFTGQGILNIGEVEELTEVASVSVGILDNLGLRSEPMVLEVVPAETVGIGVECDDTHVCAASASCSDAMVCEPAPEIVTACEGATDVAALEVGTVTQMVMIEPGDGAITATCGETPGTEQLLNIMVPEGEFDLVVTTDTEANQAVDGLDTVLYLRTPCADETTEVCSDDIEAPVSKAMPGNVLSAFTVEEAPAGMHTIGVELWRGTEEAAAVEVSIELRAR